VTRIKIFIADDTLIAREGLRSILEREEALEIVGEALSAQEIPRKVETLQPDVLLMDLSWFSDEAAGANAIEQVRAQSPSTKIIAITAYAHLIPAARKAGANAALPKGFSRETLVNLIRETHSLRPGRRGGRRTTAGSLAAGISIPILGFLIVAAALMWGIQSLSVQKFLVAIIPSLIVYFFGVVFAGRYLDVISETTTYKLFVKVLDLFRIKLPRLPFRLGGREEEETE
jgi:CheY-like chemotaxis protein